MLVTTCVSFDAAHKLEMKEKTKEQNKRWYGKCMNLHGHRYKLYVTVEGEISESGMVINFVDMRKIIYEKIINIYDHAMMNDITKEVPTAENMSLEFWSFLENEFNNWGVKLYELKLYETENSYVTLRRENDNTY